MTVTRISVNITANLLEAEDLLTEVVNVEIESEVGNWVRKVRDELNSIRDAIRAGLV